MGYEINIQKEDENQKITKNEWTDFINSDPEFEPIEEFSADLGNNEVLTVSTPNAGLWKSKNGQVPFTFSEKYGQITVKNPDTYIIEKMIQIANLIDAIVLGEEGEKYDEEYLKDPFGNPFENLSDSNEKKWWQFWK